MSSKAVKLWQEIVQLLDAATAAASPDAANEALDDVVVTMSQVEQLYPLPSATIKKLVKDAKVAQLLCKAFNDSSLKDPLSPAAGMAAFALGHFLTKVPVTAGAVGSSPPGNAQQRGGSSSLQNSSSSSSPHPSNLAAEVRMQLQTSGLQQQLARTMDAVAQQLEADAADPAALAAWWHAAGSPVLSSTGQLLLITADSLVCILDELLVTTPSRVSSDTLFWLQDGAGASAARLSLSVLRLANALMQQLAPPSGQQLTLLSGQLADAKAVDNLFRKVGVAWGACNHLQPAAFKVAPAGDPQHTSGMFATPHMFELNLASTAAAALQLQNAGRQAPTARSDGGRGSSSSNSGRSSGSSSRTRSTAANQQPAAAGGTDSAVSAWIQAHQQAASLTPLQQQLCSQLGVDARVLLWDLQTNTVRECVAQGTVGLHMHNIFLELWRKAGRLWKQQSSGENTGQSQRALQLHMLLQCVTMPALYSISISNDSSNTLLPSPSSLAELLPQAMNSLSLLPMNLAAAAGSQDLPLHTWLEDVLQGLLLLSAHFTRGQQGTQQQQQQQRGCRECGSSTVSSSKGTSTTSSSQPGGAQASSTSSSMPPRGSSAPPAVDPAATAAAQCVLHGLSDLISSVCATWSKAAAAAVYPQWQGLAGSTAAADTTLQPVCAAPLQHNSTTILAHFDCCVRAAHLCAAAGAGMFNTFMHVRRPLSSQALVLCSALLCDNSVWGAKPLFALVMWAQQAGPGSKVQRQLYSFLASLLKLCGDRLVVSGDDSEQLRLADHCRYGAAEAAGMLLLDGMTNSSGSSAAAAEGTGAVQLLPSLVVFGRVCLQWAQELQLQTAGTALQQTAAATTPLDDFSALGVCCGWLSPSTGSAVGFSFTGSSTTRLSLITESFHAWLSKQHIIDQVVAAGYDPHSLIHQLELLKQAAATAAAAVAAATSQQPPALAQAVQPLVQQLQAVGAATSTFAVQAFCNNPSCINISGPTEQQLVSGRSCICAGCRTARFCSRACLKQHWKAHKPVCQALAAAAAAAAAATANAQAAGVGSD